MQLSVIAQYYLRRLVHQYVDHCRFPLALRVGIPAQADFNQILRSRYPNAGEQRRCIQQLETWVSMYRSLETNPDLHANRETIKRQIFQLLGLRLDTLVPSQVPVTVAESEITLFRFYHDGMIRRGARYANQLYGLVKSLQVPFKLQTYAIAWMLMEQGVSVLVSGSAHQLTIWVNVRSPAYSILLTRGPEVLDRVSTLHMAVCRSKMADLVILGTNP